jgi:hypothetical protein
MPELPGLCGAPHDQNYVAREYRVWWFLAMRPANISRRSQRNRADAAQLTAKGIRKFRHETGLRRVNFIAASEASENCCAVEPNGGA